MAQQPPSPSPSPPPQAPTQNTPGPRAAGFIKLYEGALENTLRSMTYESFAACFPTIAGNAEGALRKLHGDMIVKLGELARTEFDKILLERAVITNLNTLEDLISSARKRQSRSTSSTTPQPPHTFPPTSILAAHELPILRSQTSQLNARIQTTASQNATMMAEIRGQRREIEVLMGVLEGRVADLEGAGVLISDGDGENAGEKVEKAREAEKVLSGMEE